MEDKKLFVMLCRSMNCKLTEELKSILYGISIATDVTFINTLKTKKQVKLLEGCNVNEVIDFYLYGSKTWSELKERTISLVKKYNIKNVCAIGFDMLKNFTCDSSYAASNFLKHVANGDETYGMSYVTTLTQFSKILMLKQMSDMGVNIIHLLIDPNELYLDSVGIKSKRMYKLPRDGTYFVPTFEHKLLENGKQYLANEHDRDFTFYCTAESKKRAWLIDFAKELNVVKGFDIKVFTRENRREAISQNAYYDLISRSRYTLIIPSYVNTTFSNVRFFESLSVGCLPLVLSTCDLLEMLPIYPRITKIIEKYLLVDNVADIVKKVNNMPEKLRKRIITEILNDERLSRVTSKEYMQKRWKKFLI